MNRSRWTPESGTIKNRSLGYRTINTVGIIEQNPCSVCCFMCVVWWLKVTNVYTSVAYYKYTDRSPSCLDLLYTVFQKTDPLYYFDDNFGKYGLILTIFSLLQQENYDAQNLSYFSHLTFIMLPLYLAKQTLMLVSMSLLRHYCVCV